MKSFINKLESTKELVWPVIESYYPNRSPLDHYAMVKEYPSRLGKYFRPTLILLSTKMFGGNEDEALLSAAAIQTAEDWLLVHDDVQDHSDERRSTAKQIKPTLNRVFGDELAINAGNAIHIIMWQMLGDNIKKLGTDRGLKIYDHMVESLLVTAEGQYLEISWIHDDKVLITEKEYMDMIFRKTAKYTVMGPIEIGSIIAGVDSKKLSKNMRSWTTPFGYSFQIWDDVMNLTSQTEKQGKENAGDIWEGKRTLILVDLLKKCTFIEKEFVKNIYLKKRQDKNKEEIDYILRLMNNYGCIEHAKGKARDYSKEAFDNFYKTSDLLIKDKKSMEIIEEGIKFVVNRDR